MSKGKKKRAAGLETAKTSEEPDATCIEDESPEENEADVATAEPTVEQLREEIQRLQAEKDEQFDRFITQTIDFLYDNFRLSNTEFKTFPTHIFE